MANYRVGRVSQEILREVTDILRKSVKDPRVEAVTITDVSLTGDLQQATIFYTVLTDYASEKQAARDGLTKASGLVRKELGKRLSLYKIPEITFKEDESIAYGRHIDALINQIHQDEKKVDN